MFESYFLSKRSKSSRIITSLLLIILIFSLLCLEGCASKASDSAPGGMTSQSQIKSDSAITETTQATTPAQSVSVDRKIIQNADLKMRVLDVATSVDKIVELCNQNGGYTVNSHIYRNDDSITANLSLKVPQQNLDNIITSISQYGEMTDKVISTQDVTEEYYDSEARLKVLKAKEDRLLMLMDKAANITEIISVENELSKTRSEIEVLSGRIKYLTNATDYSLVKIVFEQGVPGTLKAPQGTLGKAWQGLVASINYLISFGSNLVIFLFVFLPWALIIFLGVVLYRYIRRKIKR